MTPLLRNRDEFHELMSWHRMSGTSMPMTVFELWYYHDLYYHCILDSGIEPKLVRDVYRLYLIESGKLRVCLAGHEEPPPMERIAEVSSSIKFIYTRFRDDDGFMLHFTLSGLQYHCQQLGVNNCDEECKELLLSVDRTSEWWKRQVCNQIRQSV